MKTPPTTQPTTATEEQQLSPPLVVKKRGRKPKKDVEVPPAAAATTIAAVAAVAAVSATDDDNIVIKMEEEEPFHLTMANDELSDDEDVTPSKPSLAPKKRGRKPKGGKIIQHIVSSNNLAENRPNVILHLKCFTKDLIASNLFGSPLEGFSFSNSNTFNPSMTAQNTQPPLPQQPSEFDFELDSVDCDSTDKQQRAHDVRDIWKKLKVLEHNLHNNNTDNKKSACFWDTCEFDNPPVFIPKFFMNDTYHVYGCFCSPECAVAHLMEENIDSSVKFERYQLINHIYSKIFNFNKNIKPAPNPYYMLEKFYGNLTIQEFRSLLRNERLFLVVDKPLTRVMPELHEDNDDFIINNKIIPSNTFQVKKKALKKPTKTNILSERFGMVNN